MKSEIKEKRVILECDCWGHLVAFDYEVWKNIKILSLSFIGDHRKPFFYRLKLAWNFIFRKHDLDFCEITMVEKNVENLKQIMDLIEEK